MVENHGTQERTFKANSEKILARKKEYYGGVKGKKMKTIYLLAGIILLIGTALMGLVTKISIGIMESREITEEFIKYEPICYIGGIFFFCIVMFLVLLTKREEISELEREEA